MLLLPRSGNDTTVGPWRPSSPPQMGASVDTRAVNEISHSPFLALEEIWLAKAKIKILQAAALSVINFVDFVVVFQSGRLTRDS